MNVEELNCHVSPVMVTKPHFMREDTNFEGILLCKGHQVVALLIAAHHDPAPDYASRIGSRALRRHSLRLT